MVVADCVTRQVCVHAFFPPHHDHHHHETPTNTIVIIAWPLHCIGSVCYHQPLEMYENYRPRTNNR